MSGAAFPGLVEMILGEPDPFHEGVTRNLGMVVGWEDGYYVLIAPNGNLTRVSTTRAGLKVLGRGVIRCEGDEDEDEDALPPADPERAVA